MKKLAILLAVLIGVAGLTTIASAETMTNLQFAQLLAQKVGVTLPPGSEQLPEAEYFQALVNALAAKGITNFNNTSPTATVTSGQVAEALYTVIGGKDASLDLNGKINYLVSKGYLPSVPSDPNTAADLAAVQQTFNNPATSSTIAETYIAPAVPGADAGAAGLDAPAPTPEGISSKI